MTQSYNEDLRIGDRIGRYEILSIVGQGSMGMVYKCRHDVLGRVVAIKTLRLRAATDERTQKRFIREAQMANRLDHPNLISLIDFGNMANGDPYLVMEFVSGQSLYEIMKRERYVIPERVVHLFSQVCEGLYHAHQRGVIHRDLKPANILVIQNEHAPETVKIVDLGVAKIVHGGQEEEAEAITMTGEVCGSPIYLSPEQCMYQELDARTDIYSLGVCMYECLTGTPPLRGATVYDTIYMHVNDTPRPFSAVSANPDIPKRLEEVVLRCLSKQPKDRYETMMQVKHELINALKSQSPDSQAINVLPPESLFNGATKPAKKASGESARPTSERRQSAADKNTEETPIQARPKRKASAPLPKRPAAADSEAEIPTQTRKGSKKSLATAQSTSMPADMTKLVIMLASAFLLIGLGIGFGFAYFFTKSNDESPSATASTPAPPAPVANAPLLTTPPVVTSPVIPAPVKTPGGSTQKKAAPHGPAKTGKSTKTAAAKAPQRQLSTGEMERLLDQRDGTQRRYDSIFQNNMGQNRHNNLMSRLPRQMPRQIPMPMQAFRNNNNPQGNMQEKMKSGFWEAFKQFAADQSGGPRPASQANPMMGMGQAVPFSASPQASPFMQAPAPAAAPQQDSHKEAQAAALSNEATDLCRKNEFGPACEKFDMAYRLLPNDSHIKQMYAFALNSYAVQLNKERHYAEAVEKAKKAVALRPDSDLYLTNLRKYTQNLENQKAGTL